MSTLRWFRDEYEAHIYDRHCPAAACAELVTYSIDAEKCKGCTLCVKKCPAEAIVGAAEDAAPHRRREVHRLRQLPRRLPHGRD